MRLIDADALFDALKRAAWFDNADRDDIALDIVLDAPIIDPIKYGKWVKTDYKSMIFTKCSLCGHRVEIQNKSAFCPNCGAKMDQE